MGVDLLPSKTCSYDCIYCQLGPTMRKTIERAAYVPIEDVLQEIERKLSSDTHADYITLAGSGEPTLHAQIGEFITQTKERWPIPVAVITNGSLLHDPGVRRDLLKADVVVPSLDAARPATWQAVNQPAPELQFDAMLSGMERFREEYHGLIWLELLLLDQLTGNEAEMELMARHIERLRPDRVQVTTAVRPPHDPEARALGRPELERLAAILKLKLKATRYGGMIEVVAPAHRDQEALRDDISADELLGLLRRHPCSLDEAASGLDIHPNHAVKLMQTLIDAGEITTQIANGLVQYLAKRPGA